jgi:hypothetical protein|nr:MAG TPA: hypothetical protein [Caudoviricetes sp.]
MKIEYTSSDLQNMMDFSNELDVKKKLLKIIKDAMVEFGLTVVEETQQWKVDITKNGGSKFPYDPDDDKLYIESDDTTPKDLTTFVACIKKKPYIDMKSADRSPYSRSADSTGNDTTVVDVLNRIIEEYVVLYDKKTNSYLYIEICNSHRDRQYDLWYDILFEYDKTKTYQEQKYGASISDAVPQIIKDEEKLDKCFEVGVTYNPEMFTGIISVYRFFMFSRELKRGDSIVIVRNKGFISISYNNPKREFYTESSTFIYQHKSILNLDGNDILIATNRLLAMDKNWRDDKRFHFFYMAKTQMNYLTWYDVPYKKSTIRCVRRYLKNRLDTSFVLQDDFYSANSECKINDPPVSKKYYSIDGIPKMDATSDFSAEEDYNRHRNDNKLISSLDNTTTRFPLVYYVTRQPVDTNTLSAILENDCVSLASGVGKHNFDVVIERDESNISKYILMGKFFNKNQVIVMFEYYKKQEILSLIDMDLIILSDKILSYDKIIVTTNKGIQHIITSEELENAFLANKPVNLTGDTNLVYNVVIETDRTLRIKEKGDVEITSITGIRG